MPIVKKYLARVAAIHHSIEGVYTLEFESMGNPFKYTPGQFLHLALEEYDPSARWPESRCFSIQSSINDENLKITYAVKGDFTRKMAHQLTNGTLVSLKLPYGDLFSKDHSKVNTVFISGGTGITPYLSLFNDSSFAKYKDPVLYAGFREQNLNIYKVEIELAQKFNSSLKVNYIYQNVSGLLDITEILKQNKVDVTFFISGPPIMIRNFKEYLLNHKVPENKIITDDWE